MPGLVHIVDEDASFQTAMESFKPRRLRSRDLPVGPELTWIDCRAKVSRAASSSRCGCQD